jgi:hypothetical protein
MRLSILCSVYYSVEREDLVEQSLIFCDSVRFKCINDFKSVRVVIANTGEKLSSRILDLIDLLDYAYLSSTNDNGEFGAYRDLIAEACDSTDYMLLINDTVPTKRYVDAGLISRVMAISSTHDNDFIVGRKDIYIGKNPGWIRVKRGSATGTLSARWWYSSHLFFGNADGMKKLSFMIASATSSFNDRLVSFDIDPNIYRRIWRWLNGAGFFRWSGSKNRSSPGILMLKAKMCYTELAVSCNLRSQGIELISLSSLYFLINKLLRMEIIGHGLLGNQFFTALLICTQKNCRPSNDRKIDYT